MKLLSNCPFCESTNHQFCYPQSDYFYAVPGAFDVVKCCDCGLFFINPQPESKDLAPHYPVNYYSYNPEEDHLAAREEKLYSVFYGTESKWLKRLLYLPIRFHVRTVSGGPGTRLLDIGCGAGNFLATIKKTLQFDVYGVEPWSEDSSFAARHGLTVFHGRLEQASYPDEFFDIVTMNQVLEHVSAPKAILREIRRVLRPQGTLVLGVPNGDALLRRVCGKRWAALDVPRHLFIPTVENLRLLCEENGFTFEHVRYDGGPDIILRTLLLMMGVKHQETVPLSRLSRVACLPLVYLLNSLHLADTFEMTLRRSV